MRQQEYGNESPEKWTAKTLSLEYLRKLDLVKELTSKRQLPTPCQEPQEPDYEMEMEL